MKLADALGVQRNLQENEGKALEQNDKRSHDPLTTYLIIAMAKLIENAC